ncbi:MAG: CBS domain-containing protein [Myxococcota bacterium]|nr:CBS domain-containing protein [Myxococcota bacterium]
MARMRKSGVRRMPIVEGEALVGLVTLDDLVVHLGRELNELGSTARLAVDESRKRGRRERRRRDIEEGIAAQGPHLAIPASRAVIELAHEGESE